MPVRKATSPHQQHSEFIGWPRWRARSTQGLTSTYIPFQKTSFNQFRLHSALIHFDRSDHDDTHPYLLQCTSHHLNYDSISIYDSRYHELHIPAPAFTKHYISQTTPRDQCPERVPTHQTNFYDKILVII